MSTRGLLIVLSGPSGCGKDTVLQEVLRQRTDTVVSISVTTRAPRPGEVDGVHYFFRPKEEFLHLIQEEAFLEYAQYAGNYYGTPKVWVEQQLQAGRNVVLEIEVQGAEKVLDARPDAVSIFLQAPSMEELERRLRTRGTESEEKIRCRLEAAQRELDRSVRYRYVVVNDTVAAAVARMNRIMDAEAEKAAAACIKEESTC